MKSERLIFIMIVMLGDIVIGSATESERAKIHEIAEHKKKKRLNAMRLYQKNDSGLELQRLERAAASLEKIIDARKASQYNPADYVIPVDKIDIALDRKGFPTWQALKELMIQTYFSVIDRKTGNIIFQPNIETRLTIKRLDEELQGVKARALYSVNVDKKPVFILKIVDDSWCSLSKKVDDFTFEEEVNKLILLQKSAAARTGIQALYAQTNLVVAKKDLPIICWLEHVFLYRYQDLLTQKIEERMIEVLHAAQGEMVEKFMNSPHEKACMIALGKALASFQQLFMSYGKNPDNPALWTTYAHGDIKGDNVFFDPNTSRIYFIDNVLMRGPHFLIDLDLIDMLSITFNLDNRRACWQAYINSFPKEKREALLKYPDTNPKLYLRLSSK